MTSRRTVIALAFAAPAAAALVALALAAAPPARSATNLAYPDLGMAKLADVSLLESGGRLHLRFSATIVNVGAGPFEVMGTRTDGVSPFDVSQRVYGSDGTALLPTPNVELVWGGDGHSHWHVKNLEAYELDRLDNGVKVGTSAKSGFCFFDTTAYRTSLPGAPSTAQYRSSTGACGYNNPSATDVVMGISIGWGDKYPWNLPDQYIDITDLSAGKYRLVATADPSGWFTETNESNNVTWVDIALTTHRKSGTRVRVIGYGPTA